MNRTVLLTAALFSVGITGKAVVKGYVQPSPALVVENSDRVPAGANLPAVFSEPVGVFLNGVGDAVSIQLTGAVKDRAGRVVIPAGAPVTGTIAAIAKPATRGNQMAVGVVLDGLEVNGARIPAELDIQRIHMERSGRFGSVMDRDDALAYAGIELNGEQGAVIGLGMGDVDPVIAAGTHLVLRLRQDIRLR